MWFYLVTLAGPTNSACISKMGSKSMIRAFLLAATSAAILILSPAAFAQRSGQFAPPMKPRRC
jgi:hypothetical protein